MKRMKYIVLMAFLVNLLVIIGIIAAALLRY